MYNLIVKRNHNKPFIIDLSSAIATRLSEAKYNRLKELNPDNELLKDTEYIKSCDVDFSWWSRVTKYLTERRIYSGVDFDIDFNGKVTIYK